MAHIEKTIQANMLTSKVPCDRFFLRTIYRNCEVGHEKSSLLSHQACEEEADAHRLETSRRRGYCLGNEKGQKRLSIDVIAEFRWLYASAFDTEEEVVDGEAGEEGRNHTDGIGPYLPACLKFHTPTLTWTQNRCEPWTRAGMTSPRP